MNVKGGVTMETCLQCGEHTFIILKADRPYDIGTDGLDHISVCASCGKTNILHSLPSLDMEYPVESAPGSPLSKETMEFQPPGVENYTVASDRVKLDPIKGVGTIEYGDLKKNSGPPDVRARDGRCQSLSPVNHVRCNGSDGHKGGHHHFDKKWTDDPQDVEEYLNKCVVKAFSEENARGRENVILPGSTPDPNRIITQIFTAEERVKIDLGQNNPKAYMAPKTFDDMRQIGIVMKDGENLTIAGVPIEIDTGMISGIVIEQEEE